MPPDLERTTKLQIAQYPACDPQEDAENIDKHHAVHRVHTKIGERRKNFRRVVDLMEIPEHRDPVAQIMIDPVAKFVGEKQEHRHDRLAGDLVQPCLGKDTEHVGQSATHDVTDESRGDDRPSKENPGEQDVEKKKPDVGSEGGASQPARKQCPAHHAVLDVPSSRGDGSIEGMRPRCTAH